VTPEWNARTAPSVNVIFVMVFSLKIYRILK